MEEREYLRAVDAPNAESALKVSHGVGGIATASAANSYPDPSSQDPGEPTIAEAAPGLHPIKIEFRYGRRNAINRSFPDLKDRPDEEVRALLTALPGLIEQGRDRFHPRRDVEHQMRVVYSWLEGMTTEEVAQSEGLSHPSVVSQTVAQLLRAIRTHFSPEEIVTGHTIEIEREPEKEYTENFRRLFSTAYPEQDLAKLDFEQARRIVSALATVSRPKDQVRIQKALEGQTDREIGLAEGLSHKAIWEWRRWIMVRKISPNVPFDELYDMVQSDNPEESLVKLFKKVDFDVHKSKSPIQESKKRRTIKTRSQARSIAAETDIQKKLSLPEPDGKLGRSAASIDFWSGVAKELSSQRNRQSMGGEVVEVIEVLGAPLVDDLPEPESDYS